MTAAVRRSTPSLSIPPTQNTATVVEFDCLYTHDLRRKQKRWQDGFLRYHTFNKRAMVYDVPRNFLGDLHWTEGGDIQEGEELTLEKGGILVQVGEEVGRKETDLSGLLSKKDTSSPSRKLSSPNASVPRQFISRPQTPAAASQGKHVSLNSLLGPSRRPIGKVSLPATSPFDIRQRDQENEQWPSGREPKRQKIDSWNVTKTTKPTKTPKPVSGSTASSTRTKSRTESKTSTKQADSLQRKLGVTEIIDISSDTEQTPSVSARSRLTEDDLLASSPSRPLNQPSFVSNARSRDAARSSRDRDIPGQAGTMVVPVGEPQSVRQLQPMRPNVAKQGLATPIRRQKGAAIAREEGQVPGGVEQSSSPPVSVGNRVTANAPQPDDSPFFSAEPRPQKQGRALKLVASAPRRMLVSRGQTTKANTRKDGDIIAEQTRQLGERQRDLSVRGLHEEVGRSQHMETDDLSEPQSIHRQRLQERLARISKRPPDESTIEEDISLDVTPSAPENASRPQPLSISDTERVINSADHSPTRQTRNVETSQHRLTSKSTPSVLHPQARELIPAGHMHDRPREKPPSPKPPPVPQVVAPEPITAKSMPPPPRSAKRTNQNSKQAPTYNTRAEGVTAVMLAKPFKPPAARPSAAPVSVSDQPEKEQQRGKQDTDLGPWSREAFDLMDWRPPDRETTGTTKEAGPGLESVAIGHQMTSRVGLSGGVDDRG